MKLVGGVGPVDMFGWDLEGIADSDPVTETATKAVFNNGADHEVYTFTGKGFTYDHGLPVGGTITGFELATDGESTFTITGLKLKVADFMDYLDGQDLPGLMAKILSGADNIKGSALSDTLGGLGGDDVVNGGKGADVISGGAGADMLTGGKGADLFIYAALSDSRGETVDTITDLEKSDTIDLSAIDANSKKGGDQAFKLVEAFTHHAGEAALTFESANARTLLQLDVDGDGQADAAIYLSGDQTAFHHFVL